MPLGIEVLGGEKVIEGFFFELAALGFVDAHGNSPLRDKR
jgi:hypothetical protein